MDQNEKAKEGIEEVYPALLGRGHELKTGMMALTVNFERVARGTDLIAERAAEAARVDVLGLHVDFDAVLPAGAVHTVRALEGSVHQDHLGPHGGVHVIVSYQRK